MSNPEAIGDSLDTLEGVLETLDGTAKDVFRLVMVDHVGTGSSTLLAHVFVGLSTDLKVRLFNPCRLDRNNYRRLINLIDEAAYDSWGWSQAATLMAKKYNIQGGRHVGTDKTTG